MLVNHEIKGLFNGVSQQAEALKYESQVDEMINCMPDVTRGVLRRNPLEAINFIDYKKFVTSYGDDCYLTRGYKFEDGYMNVYMSQCDDNGKAVYDSDGNLVLTSLPIASVKPFIYYYNRDNIEKYYMIFNGMGDVFIIDAKTFTLKQQLHSPYFSVPEDGTRTFTDGTYTVHASYKEVTKYLKALTIGDYTFIVNKSVTTKMKDITDGNIDDEKRVGVYWVKRTTSVVKKIDNNNYYYKGYTYTLNGVTSSEENGVDATKVVEDLANQLGGDYQTDTTFIYNKNMQPDDTWEWTDGAGGTMSQGFKGSISAVTMLPANMPTDLKDIVVKIEGAYKDNIDDYYVKWNGYTWVETVKPGLQNEIDASTMPHTIVRQSDGTFIVNEYTWDKRAVGDLDSNPNPSFINNEISDIFFYRNRLGIVSKDSVVLSELSNYGNFFATTVKDIPDTDPIDLSIATTDVNYIKYAVPINKILLLFSENRQFILSSEGQTLTPTTAVLDILSSYSINPDIEPKAIGNQVIFASDNSGYSNVYSYIVTNQGGLSNDAIELSIQIPSYLPNTISEIEGNGVNPNIFFTDKENNTNLYIFTYKQTQDKLLQSAWHKWVFNKSIMNVVIENNTLYMIMSDIDGNLYLNKISLKIPPTIEGIDYKDIDTEFTSEIRVSEWFIRNSEQVGNTRVRLQVRTAKFNFTEDSKWKIDVYNKLYDTHKYYYNDEKITVSGNAKDIRLRILNNGNSGFVLSTINLEGFLTQRGRTI